MDSRIREAHEEIEKALSDVVRYSDDKDLTLGAELGLEALALLTAEPDPCEDVRRSIEKEVRAGFAQKALNTIPKLTYALDGWIRAGWNTEHMAGDLLRFWLPDRSWVDDKRAEELRALREALEPFADADCEDERHSDEDDPQLLSCEEYGKPRAEWCAVCNAKEVLAATEPKP